MADRDWFEIQTFANGITMVREPHHSEDVKSYLVEGERAVAVIDTGTGAGDFAGIVSEASSRPPLLLQTHAHWDHIGASYRFEGALVHGSETEALRRGISPERYRHVFWRDPFERDRVPDDFDAGTGVPGSDSTGELNDGDRIDLGGRALEVLHTPGHSPGGCSFLDRQARALFPGDLLYLGPIYVFYPDSDPAAFRDSLGRVASLASEVDAIYPSRGASPMSASDAIAIRDAFESVWSGRRADRDGSLYGHATAVHDFGRFSFLLAR